MSLNLIKLKVKVKHLAVEPAIIRKEATKLSGMNKWELQHHVKDVIRPEARATQLTVAYIKGKPYSSIEKSRKLEKEVDFRLKVVPRVVKMVQKYHDRTATKKDIMEWLNT